MGNREVWGAVVALIGSAFAGCGSAGTPAATNLSEGCFESHFECAMPVSGECVFEGTDCDTQPPEDRVDCTLTCTDIWQCSCGEIRMERVHALIGGTSTVSVSCYEDGELATSHDDDDGFGYIWEQRAEFCGWDAEFSPCPLSCTDCDCDFLTPLTEPWCTHDAFVVNPESGLTIDGERSYNELTVIEAFATPDCDCTRPGRAPLDEEYRHALDKAVARGEAQATQCACEIMSFTEQQESGVDPVVAGWHLYDPIYPPGTDAELVPDCASSVGAVIFDGGAEPDPESQVLLAVF